jgi:fatty acid desaturase
MTYAFVFLLSLLGFAMLLLAMARHQQDWIRRKLTSSTTRALRIAGLVALALAFFVACIGLGWGAGAVAWFGWLTVAAAIVVAVNVNRERLGLLVRKVRL